MKKVLYTGVVAVALILNISTVESSSPNSWSLGNETANDAAAIFPFGDNPANEANDPLFPSSPPSSFGNIYELNNQDASDTTSLPLLTMDTGVQPPEPLIGSGLFFSDSEYSPFSTGHWCLTEEALFPSGSAFLPEEFPPATSVSTNLSPEAAIPANAGIEQHHPVPTDVLYEDDLAEEPAPKHPRVCKLEMPQDKKRWWEKLSIHTRRGYLSDFKIEKQVLSKVIGYNDLTEEQQLTILVLLKGVSPFRDKEYLAVKHPDILRILCNIPNDVCTEIITAIREFKQQASVSWNKLTQKYPEYSDQIKEVQEIVEHRVADAHITRKK